MPKHRYAVLSNDVWGNEKDGWEVNASYRLGFVFIDPDWDDERILAEVARFVGEYDTDEAVRDAVAGWEVEDGGDICWMTLLSPAGCPSYTLQLDEE